MDGTRRTGFHPRPHGRQLHAPATCSAAARDQANRLAWIAGNNFAQPHAVGGGARANKRGPPKRPRAQHRAGRTCTWESNQTQSSPMPHDQSRGRMDALPEETRSSPVVQKFDGNTMHHAPSSSCAPGGVASTRWSSNNFTDLGNTGEGRVSSLRHDLRQGRADVRWDATQQTPGTPERAGYGSFLPGRWRRAQQA